ncbi:hypothetical protein [Xenorhabdus japonica]|uniref:Uncharacterized protein n=1 Tax=Xenorhabdus japonica TaxID=53341 RepID=A0A1I5BTI3_9GAMM|nr:hypothetical protein [Xenorhabdus japonica]SFN77922.1 hypothetical protein SAMN05421579_12159 [Xenorhabdus japonica]
MSIKLVRNTLSLTTETSSQSYAVNSKCLQVIGIYLVKQSLKLKIFSKYGKPIQNNIKNTWIRMIGAISEKGGQLL